MSSMKLRTTTYTVAPEGATLYSSEAYRVSVDDNGGGEFISIESGHDAHIEINPEDWPCIKDAIEMTVNNIQRHEEECRKHREFIANRPHLPYKAETSDG